MRFVQLTAIVTYNASVSYIIVISAIAVLPQLNQSTVLGYMHLTVLQMDDHFVTINYYADIPEDSSNDKTSTSEPHLQIHDNRADSTETSSPGERRMSMVQPKVVRHRFLATVGILFIIGSFSIPVVLYYTQDKVDLSTLTAIGNVTLVSIMHVIMYLYVSCIRLW